MVLAGLALAASTTWAARNILVFGDSLSAGYGIPQDAAWPSLLAKRLEQKRLDYSVTNASISGETTSGGRTRLAAALDKAQPAVVVIALGANDGLRGLPIKAMARAVREAGIAVSVSQTAGTFVCNQVFYRLQHELAGSGVRSGFIHVPSQLGAGLVDGLRIAVSTAWNTPVDVVEVGGQVS